MSETPVSDAVESFSFEDALKELEAIVDRLDRGEVPLAESIAAYERGTRLRRHCEKLLGDARLRVERLVGDGATPATQPLDEDEA